MKPYRKTIHLLLCLLPLPAVARAQAPAPTPSPQASPAVGFPGQWVPHLQKYPVYASGCGRLEDPTERLACSEFILADWPRLSRFAAANAELSPPRPGEDRVVFFGDSITDNWSRPAYGGFFPGKPYVNRGIGGQTTAQMLVRFRADVVNLKPRVVVILAGTNDVSGNNGPVTPESIQDNLAGMAELARASGIRVVLASILPVSDDKKDANGVPVVRTKGRPPETLLALNRWITGYAAKERLVFLDYHAAMADGRGLLKPELNDDGLHPNAAGYAVMAPLAQKAIDEALRR
jgi:lysophospholipase L1-like esterase